MHQHFNVILYGHENCCLCHEAALLLDELHNEYLFAVEKVDVRTDEKYAALRCHIPVITINGSNRVALRITSTRLRRAFERASQRREISE